MTKWRTVEIAAEDLGMTVQAVRSLLRRKLLKGWRGVHGWWMVAYPYDRTPGLSGRPRRQQESLPA